MTASADLLYICAIIRAKPGSEQKLKTALYDVVKKTQAERGCLLFQIHQTKDDPLKFVLWECFESRQALHDHIQTDYTQHYFATAREYMSHPTEVMELSKFA